jgi:hypothetical protein
MRIKEQEFIKIMGLYKDSGLNVTEFCIKYSISKTRFYKYQRSIRTLERTAPTRGTSFEPIKLVSEVKEEGPINTVIYFPNKIRCEFEVKDKESQLMLLKELASLC